MPEKLLLKLLHGVSVILSTLMRGCETWIPRPNTKKIDQKRRERECGGE